MLTWLRIFEIVMLLCCSGAARGKRSNKYQTDPLLNVTMHPPERRPKWADVETGPPPPNITTCEEFERGARFNPYLIIDSLWKIIYFWANHTEVYPITFGLPSQNRLHSFSEVVEAVLPGLAVEWRRATLFMTPRPGTEVLFLYQGTPGAFRAVIKKEQRNKGRPHPPPLIKFSDVRIKMVDNILGMMCCEDLTAYVFSRVDDMPTTEAGCEHIAARIGYHAPNGKSYLYFKRRFTDEL